MQTPIPSFAAGENGKKLVAARELAEYSAIFSAATSFFSFHPAAEPVHRLPQPAIHAANFPRGNWELFLPNNFKMADEDEEDYMSDKFLFGAGENAPGLVPDKIAKKYRKEMKHNELNQRNKIKPMRERETEKREQGLASALDSSNKGFAMLQKMGFKQGMGLGKDGTWFKDLLTE